MTSAPASAGAFSWPKGSHRSSKAGTSLTTSNPISLDGQLCGWISRATVGTCADLACLSHFLSPLVQESTQALLRLVHDAAFETALRGQFDEDRETVESILQSALNILEGKALA